MADASTAPELTTDLRAISVIERVCSVLSLMGCVFIIATFFASKAFHKPINRLVFYASFGNMMCNVGTLMARSYITLPDSVGCQLQGFLIQLFMPADAFWTLAMAINVYLTFYHKFDAQKLRRMELPYLLCCYGIPAIPSLAYVFVRNPNGQRVFGNATLWCWVTPEWDVLRIATFYGPVWVVILVTFFVYIRAGRTIYEKRKQLQDFNQPVPDVFVDPFGTLKTTEVTVTSEVIMHDDSEIKMGSITGRPASSPGAQGGTQNAYSVTISADRPKYQSQGVGAVDSNDGRTTTTTTAMTTAAITTPPNRHNRINEYNNAAWSYTKCAVLFFSAILITWIPSSANRVYSVVHANGRSLPLEYMSAFVLPLQGFWNAAIYMITSWTACKDLYRALRSGRRPDVPDYNYTFRAANSAVNRRENKNYESESTTELANTRPNSDEQTGSGQTPTP